ncbi:energy-coupling factor transporter ATPase [Sporolactobacillus sp. Y61]|uniref:Energy-coupling factor transporter ATPase n=1 Tax=Sporolactobacillus sp. Y61 TaxID=3160863 RepID=A0AAU8IFD0_9BACL|nr:energy-coupling factor transporter ATPase [Sporolactobacillus sp. THM19-2]RYL92424.1 energy-coupling factor transporter ATPase [Sporolactobacillus sp. THM19-2]
MAIIEVRNVSFKYDRREKANTLSSVSFDVHQGEWLSVIGNNGAGKSTLARLLVGLLKPSCGTIRIKGVVLNEENKWEIRRHAGIVFQNPDNQFIGATVQDDVAFGLENINMPVKEMRVRVEEALKSVGLSQLKEADPSRLSGGQKQRVAIAGVLALKPDILILDESLVMLDPASRREMLRTLQKLRAGGRLTILSITHDMNEAAKSDRILVLKNGRLVNDGTPRQIFSTEMEMEAPFSERLRRLLLKNGRRAPRHYMTENEMVQWLCK